MLGMFGNRSRSNRFANGLVEGDGMGPNFDMTGIDQSRLPRVNDGPLPMQILQGQMPPGLASPQLQTMPMPPMPQGAPAPRRGNGLRNVAGVLGDMLATAGGGRAMFIPQMMQEREQQRQLQLQQQLQAEQRAYEESQWQRRQDYARANPEPRYFEDNAGNQWQMGPNGPQLVFRDPTPRYQFVQGVDADGNTVMQQVPIPNNVPAPSAPQVSPQGAPQASGGLRPLPESQAAPMRRALGEQGFAQYLQRQGLMVVPDGANAASPQEAIIAEMRRRGLM